MEFSTRFQIKRCTDCVKIKPLEAIDMQLFDKLIETKKQYFCGTFSTPVNRKTYDQVKTVWKLVDIIFQSMENRKPTAEESRELYEDLLEEYAEKRPSKLDDKKLVPVHVSKADTKACAYFIEGLMIHLAEYCDLNMTAQTEVKQLFTEWENWKYSNVTDDNCTMEEYHERHRISEASGMGGTLHLHHIVTKGSSEKLRNVTANWVMLTAEDHQLLHQYGDNWFLKQFPHLKAKFEYAKGLQK